MGPSGKIYVMPGEGNAHILVIDTTNSVSTLGTSLNKSYANGILAPNGKIYSIPETANDILEVDVMNQTISALFSGDSNISATNIKYKGGVLGNNGKIYAIPYKADRVLEIDPKAIGNFNSNIPLSSVFNKF